MHVGFDLGKGGGQVCAFNAPSDEGASSLIPCARVSSFICLSFSFGNEGGSCSMVPSRAYSCWAHRAGAKLFKRNAFDSCKS